jgi:hypothetical protein
VTGGRLGVAAIAAACTLTAARGADDGAYATGALAWFSSERYELIGSMSAEIPIVTPADWRVYFGAEALTAIENASGFTFTVGQIDYAAALGARHRFDDSRGALDLFVAEQGRQSVDAVGTARVRTAGAAWESAAFRDGYPRDGWAGRASLAAVWEHAGVDAVATSTGTVRWMRRVGRARAIALGADLRWDALFGTDHGADVLAGPRLDFDLGGDRRFGLYARWLSARNPLGLGTDGLLAGFDFSQGPAGAARERPPEISGLVAAGGGDAGRAMARLDLRVDSPPFLHGTYGEIEVDGNVLTAEDGNDLFYLYDVGVLHSVGAAWRAGVFFRHRSNHLLDQANATVTSINVVEAAIETIGWRRSTPGVELGRAGAVDLSLRAGWLVDSAFGEDAAWHARGGVRWSSPEWHATRLYVSAAAERGDVDASAYAVGALLPREWDLRVEVGHDEQLYSADDRGVFAVATLRF